MFAIPKRSDELTMVRRSVLCLTHHRALDALQSSVTHWPIWTLQTENMSHDESPAIQINLIITPRHIDKEIDSRLCCHLKKWSFLRNTDVRQGKATLFI